MIGNGCQKNGICIYSDRNIHLETECPFRSKGSCFEDNKPCEHCDPETFKCTSKEAIEDRFNPKTLTEAELKNTKITKLPKINKIYPKNVAETIIEKSEMI